MNEEQELRDRLWAADVPPSRVEVDALLRAGRGRVFRRRSGQAAIGVALAVGALVTVPTLVTGASKRPATQSAASPVATPATAAPAKACAVTALPVPAGMKRVATTAVDPTGRFIVGNNTVGQDFRPILWTDGKAQALPVPEKSVQLTAVNASGVVVGLAEDGPDSYVFRYANGQYTKLETPPGKWHPYPTPTINAAGDVVINAEPQGNVEGKGKISLIWKAGSTTATRLPLPPTASVHDITDDGTVIGTIYKNGHGVAGYAWDQQGKGRKLETPAGRATAAYAAEGDWVVGGLWPDMMPALWNIRTGERIEVGATAVTRAKKQGDGPGPANAVNASGVVVAGGFVYRDGHAVTLEAPDGETVRAAAVADNNLIVGRSVDGAGENIGPKVWRC